MKKYKVVEDLQGETFAMFNRDGTERIQTIEEWRETALDWADSDYLEALCKTLKRLPRKKVIGFIAETWAIVFEEVEQKCI